ncbi:hypothetical protein LR48_Vigan549s011500 [Vigna angularis]|uniref:Uncharacterized protein n=1 Tax=Phaseolus angularis TaxID=3914 RepID=A0A0L9TD75_PHAAN|nr:hypothetical protein LR48_Vigan549s011500 [Vigna angularis]
MWTKLSWRFILMFRECSSSSRGDYYITGCTNVVATQNSYGPDNGEALLEETLEEGILEEENLVDVEVKAEQ